MQKSLLVDHLEVALRLSKSDGSFFTSYFIEMAIDAARKSSVLSESVDRTATKKRNAWNVLLILRFPDRISVDPYVGTCSLA